MRTTAFVVMTIAQLLLGTSVAVDNNTFRWKGFCISGSTLDSGATDQAVADLLDWIGPGQSVTGTSTSTKTVKWSKSFSQDNVFTYACIDAEGETVNFNQGDAHGALAAMDMDCPRYQPSYAIVEENVQDRWFTTSKIIGKSRVGTPVCLDFDGGTEGPDTTPGGGVEW